jgi:DNA polymerase
LIAAKQQVKGLRDMIAQTNHSIASEMAAALDWWRDAGVDFDFADDARDWLAQTAQPDAAQEAAPPPLPAAFRQHKTEPQRPAPGAPTIGGDPDAWPKDFASFPAWWLAEPSLDNGRVSNRVPPRGVHGAEVMVLVAEPEQGDADRLLSGAQGALLDAMLAAMGVAADAAYIASALPRHTPMADWADLTAQGLGAVVRHHVTLAAPKRLIVLGGNILPLLGNDLPISPDILRRFNHEGASLPVLAGPDLAILLARPLGKSRIWQAWLQMEP